LHLKSPIGQSEYEKSPENFEVNILRQADQFEGVKNSENCFNFTP
jgi:hypothetical protein